MPRVADELVLRRSVAIVTCGMRKVLAALLFGALLAGCGAPMAATPSPHGSALPVGELGCFRELRVIPAAGTPVIGRGEAEARAREDSTSWMHRPVGLVSARPVTVLAGEGRPGLLGGRDVWLLGFEMSPVAGPVGTASPAGTVRGYVLVDAATGAVWNVCVVSP